MNTLNTARIEELGKLAAVKHLEKKGYEILEENWSTKEGTIDFIAEDEDVLAFIKVIASNKYIPIHESLVRISSESFASLLEEYKTNHDIGDKATTFDLIEVLGVCEDYAFLRYHGYALRMDE